jgi:hypothetical protein
MAGDNYSITVTDEQHTAQLELQPGDLFWIANNNEDNVPSQYIIADINHIERRLDVCCAFVSYQHLRKTPKKIFVLYLFLSKLQTHTRGNNP